jgi:hypothetical protein
MAKVTMTFATDTVFNAVKFLSNIVADGPNDSNMTQAQIGIVSASAVSKGINSSAVFSPSGISDFQGWVKKHAFGLNVTNYEFTETQ